MLLRVRKKGLFQQGGNLTNLSKFFERDIDVRDVDPQIGRFALLSLNLLLTFRCGAYIYAIAILTTKRSIFEIRFSSFLSSALLFIFSLHLSQDFES